MSTGVCVGQSHQVNFIGDEIATVEFASVDLSLAALERLWQHLPDEVDIGDVLSQEGPPLAQPTPASLATLLFPSEAMVDPVWDVLQTPAVLDVGTDGLTVYPDGSLQNSGSEECCG